MIRMEPETTICSIFEFRWHNMLRHWEEVYRISPPCQT
jgi:hypothetical protein